MIRCPQCQMSMPPGVIARHMPICLDAPGMRERVTAALVHPDKPGHITTTARYHVLAAAHGLTGVDHLRKRYGRWSDIAAAFGLRGGSKTDPYSNYGLPPQEEEALLSRIGAELQRTRGRLARAGKWPLQGQAAWRLVREWGFAKDERGNLIRDERGHLVGRWEPCVWQRVCLLR